MDDHGTPDLFGWAEKCAPKGALIVPFPQDRNVGKARHVAATFLARKSEKDREAYWKRTVTSLWRQLARSGFSEAAIDREIDNFREAVQAEIYRIEATRKHPGGAA